MNQNKYGIIIRNQTLLTRVPTIYLIRFWTMANTFTGLKLQGQIGKFGAKELSDIEG